MNLLNFSYLARSDVRGIFSLGACLPSLMLYMCLNGNLKRDSAIVRCV